jgi:hypothetical protein
MIAGEAEAGNAPAGDVTKTDGAADGQDAGKGRTAGVGGSKDAADAGTGNMSDRNVILFEDFDYAEVREAARESAAKGQSDSGPGGNLKFFPGFAVFNHGVKY